MEKNPKMEIAYRTEPGVAHFPHLDKLDTKFVKKESDRASYSTGVILSAKDAAPLIAIVDGIIEEEFTKKDIPLLTLPYKEQDDGTVVFRAKAYEQPVVFDAWGRRQVEVPPIGSGSILRLAGTMRAYNTGPRSKGVTAYLSHVLVVELVERALPASTAPHSGPDYQHSNVNPFA